MVVKKITTSKPEKALSLHHFSEVTTDKIILKGKHMLLAATLAGSIKAVNTEKLPQL